MLKTKLNLVKLATLLGASFGAGVLDELRSVREEDGKKVFAHTIPRLPFVGFGGTYGPLLIIGASFIPPKHKGIAEGMMDIGTGFTLEAAGSIGRKLMFSAQRENLKKYPLPKKELEAAKKAAGTKVSGINDFMVHGDVPFIPATEDVPVGTLGNEEVIIPEYAQLSGMPPIFPAIDQPQAETFQGDFVGAEEGSYVAAWANEPYPDANLYGLN